MSGSQNLLRHSFLLMIAANVGNLASVFFQMYVGRRLSPSEYGILASMLGLIMMAGMPLGALGNVLTFFSAHLVRANRSGDIMALVRWWTALMLVITLAFLMIGIFCSRSLAVFFQLPDKTPLFWTFGVLVVAMFASVINGALQGKQAFGWSALAGMIWAVARLGVGVLFVGGISATAALALAGHGAGVLIGALTGLIGLKIVLRDERPTQSALPAAWGYLWGTLITLAFFAFLMNADILMIKHFFEPNQSGLYARAGTIGRIIIFLPMPIAGALFPKVVSYGELQREHLRLLGRALCYAALVILPAVLVCVVFPALPLGILYHDWQPAPAMVRLLRATVLAMTPLGMASVFVYFELAQNRFRMLWPLTACVLAYVGGVMLWHHTLLEIIAVLATVGGALLLAFGMALFRQQKRLGAQGSGAN